MTWLSNLPLGSGGASLTDEAIVREGIRRGHEILVRLPGQPLPEGDLVIVSNLVGFMKQLLNRLKDYVIFLHDFQPLCDWKLYFPLADRCRRCKNRDWTLGFLERSKGISWMSPLHRRAWLHAVPEIDDHPYTLTPSAFDQSWVERLKNLRNSNPDERTVLGINSLYRFKGKAAVLDYAKEHLGLRFTFLGGYEGDLNLPPNCSYLGLVNEQQLFHGYGVNERVIHLPYLDPCSRITAEAILAGRKMIYNRAIGLLSYFDHFPNPDEVGRLVLSSASNFWEFIEKEVMG